MPGMVAARSPCRLLTCCRVDPFTCARLARDWQCKSRELLCRELKCKQVLLLHKLAAFPACMSEDTGGCNHGISHQLTSLHMCMNQPCNRSIVC